MDAMADDPLLKKHAPRILLATDGEEVYYRDIKADQTRDPRFDKLNDIFDFFLPLAGIERYEGVVENPADIKQRRGSPNSMMRFWILTRSGWETTTPTNSIFS
ncbi:MAG: type IIL restriction-modification enzyme MmeI [Candidatus Nitrotoga sp.]